MRRVIETIDHLVTGPTVEPLDLAEIKKALRFGSTTEDTLLDSWLAAARQQFEEQTGRQVMLATRELWLSGTPCATQIELPCPPLRSIVQVSYDVEGEETLMDSDAYEVVAPQGPTCQRGRIVLADGSSWPLVDGKPNALRIRYTCGYGDVPGAVPELVKAALYLLIGHFHQFRSDTFEGNAATSIPMGVESILRRFQYTALPVLPALEGGVAWA